MSFFWTWSFFHQGAATGVGTRRKCRIDLEVKILECRNEYKIRKPIPSQSVIGFRSSIDGRNHGQHRVPEPVWGLIMQKNANYAYIMRCVKLTFLNNNASRPAHGMRFQEAKRTAIGYDSGSYNFRHSKGGN